MKVIIGSRVPPRTSMFERRDGLGGYSRAMPPILGDAATLQAALLAKPRRSRMFELRDWSERDATIMVLLALWIVGMLFIWWI